MFCEAVLFPALSSFVYVNVGLLLSVAFGSWLGLDCDLVLVSHSVVCPIIGKYFCYLIILYSFYITAELRVLSNLS